MQQVSGYPTISRYTFWPGAALARQCLIGAGLRRSVISDGLSLYTPVKFGISLIQRLEIPKTASNTISGVRQLKPKTPGTLKGSDHCPSLLNSAHLAIRLLCGHLRANHDLKTEKSRDGAGSSIKEPPAQVGRPPEPSTVPRAVVPWNKSRCPAS